LNPGSPHRSPERLADGTLEVKALSPGCIRNDDWQPAAHPPRDMLAAEQLQDELAVLTDTSRLPDMKTLSVIQTLRVRRPDLFR